MNSEEQFENFEKNSLYYIGFGFPVTLLTFFLPFFLAYSIASMALAWMIIASVPSGPKEQQEFFPRFWFTWLVCKLYLNKALDWLKSKAQGSEFNNFIGPLNSSGPLLKNSPATEKEDK